MRTMSAEEFKARCLKIMDEVCVTREPVLITKKGRRVAKLVPAEAQPEDVFGCLVGVVEIMGDTEAPVVKPKNWKGLR